MKFIYYTTDSQVINFCNGEGFLYLYFQRLTAYFFLVLSIISILFLIPLYLIRFDKSETIVNSILKPTVANAYDNPFKLWIVLACSLLYTMFAYFFLYTFTKKIASIRSSHKHVDNSFDTDIPLHTIHIRGINQNLPYLDVKKILDSFFEQHFNQLVAGIQVIPNYDILCSLINRKFVYQSRHDSYNHSNTLTYPNRAVIKVYEGIIDCHKVDAEIYYNHWVDIVDQMINFYRQLNMKKNTGNAFICFKSPKTVNDILKNVNVIFSKMNTFEGTLLNIDNWIIKRAPSPSDIVWDNIKYSKKWRTIRMIFFTFILFVVCLIIITPNFINDELSPLISDISKQIDDQDTRNIITEYSYTLIVVIMNSGVIPIVVGYIAMFELHYKRSYREKSIFIKNVIFMIVNCFFIPTFGVLEISKIKKYIGFLIKSGWDWDVSEGFIKNSYFFMRYIIQVTFVSNGIQLLSLPQFFVRKFRVFMASSNYEKFYASLIKKYFDYGYHYSFSITVFILTLVFSTTIPLIVPFGCLFFVLKYYIDKYNLLFVYPVEFESHGNITAMVLKFALIGIFFFQFIISNLFIKIFHDKDYAIYATILYIVISLFIYYGMKNFFLSNTKDTNESIFDKFLNQSKIKQLFFRKSQNSLFYDSYNEQRLSMLSKANSGEPLSEETLIKIMKEAYVHPAEKNQIVNPIQIWNDSYTFMKTHSENPKKTKAYFEYENIIQPNSQNSRYTVFN